MKRRDTGRPATAADESARRAEAQTELARALAAVADPDQMTAFLIDLCTPAELEALADRWSVVPLLADGVSYRQVHEQTGVSVTTVGRVARSLEHGTGGYRQVLEQCRGELEQNREAALARDHSEAGPGPGDPTLRHTRGAQPATG
ncbi:DNA-binding transcriptional regulator [Ornithinimicrobium ciconiae]|uniref:DNA-binding transcriptional regulator n=1 Tax=Ornithinimicrobium ciconiae TaxID=2594265 RepID=A0A516GAZ3_9MICO|nr:YerC/YecD family TrpR-related protein [Ornithinimicrobium ciconiae]QDO88662.1 DNA-binding transcriptional regulator [Ornithinimicrobium ciconiae]